jgi:hypothetical protein
MFVQWGFLGSCQLCPFGKVALRIATDNKFYLVQGQTLSISNDKDQMIEV